MLFNRQMWSCLVVLVVCFSPVVRSEDECPDPVNIKPCQCGNGLVYCDGISDVAVLEDVFDKSDEPFPYFIVINSNLMYIPSRGLNQKNIKKMHIVNTNLVTLFDRQPEENHSLDYLVWIGSRMARGFLWEHFQPLKGLKSVSILSTVVNGLGKSFEQSVSPTLVSLQLQGTATKKFSPTMFQKLVNVKNVEITNTRLSTLKRSMFPDRCQLVRLYLLYNSIASLPDDIFSNMPDLQEVNLRNNRLKIFSEAVFGHIMDKSAKLIDVQENPISCDCSLKWVLFKEGSRSVLGKCANPISRKGKDFQRLTRHEFSYCPSDSTLLETSILV